MHCYQKQRKRFYNDKSQPTKFSSVQSLSRVRLFATPWTAAPQASLSITNSWSSLRLRSIKSVMPSSHLNLCRPLLLLPPIPPSIRVFSNESTLLTRWPKYWSFSFSIIPSKEIPGLISFRMDWLDLLAVQGTLKSRLQHHSSKASILRHSAFFIVYTYWPVQFSFSVMSDSLQPMDCCTPGLPVHHHLLEFSQTHVHHVSDAIQPSHPLLSPSPLTFSLAQHHCLFQWVSFSHQVATVLKFQLQHQSLQWIFRTDFL